jgi:hypothetical protein
MVYEKNLEGKPIKTKNEFAEEALEYAKNLDINPVHVCFESKFSSLSIFKVCHIKYGFNVFSLSGLFNLASFLGANFIDSFIFIFF